MVMQMVLNRVKKTWLSHFYCVNFPTGLSVCLSIYLQYLSILIGFHVIYSKAETISHTSAWQYTATLIAVAFAFLSLNMLPSLLMSPEL